VTSVTAEYTPTRTPPSPLRLRRLTLGFTQADVAALSGLSREHITRLEQGVCHPQRRTARDLAVALGCAPSDIFPENDQTPAGERPGSGETTSGAGVAGDVYRSG
jgi:transcriptional regulator with XRE-family HTH domain